MDAWKLLFSLKRQSNFNREDGKAAGAHLLVFLFLFIKRVVSTLSALSTHDWTPLSKLVCGAIKSYLLKLLVYRLKHIIKIYAYRNGEIVNNL